ncbi:hypothetical protein TNCV_5032611 [Trichonephila clavipes]|nr:hypothetical protein TNCV_5032611 [Trichonephila clavipes]
MSRCPDQVVSLKRDPQRLSPHASLVLICRPIALDKTPKETYVVLVRVYDDQALSMKRVYELFTYFRKGQESVFDTPLAEDRRTPE